MYVGKEKITLSNGDGFFINSGIPHVFLAADEEEVWQKSLVFDPILIGGQFEGKWEKTCFIQRNTPLLSVPLRSQVTGATL